jgi:hypothetical protein
MPTLLGRALRDAFVRGEPVSDATFDRIYPADLRELSAIHWTPVSVAAKAARLLAPSPPTRVLDVGAGSGKLCLIGALTAGGSWHGIDEDPTLVAAAIRAAHVLGTETGTTFSTGDVVSMDWTPFDALYFYNPFASALEDSLEDPITRWSVFGARVKQAQERLIRLRAGTRVVTYHGIGGEMPPGFQLISREPVGTDYMDLWVRSGPPRRPVSRPEADGVESRRVAEVHVPARGGPGASDELAGDAVVRPDPARGRGQGGHGHLCR